MFYVFPAMAQEASVSAAVSGFDFKGLIPFVLIIGVMYLFLIRPQQKKMKQHQEMVSNIRRGDRVLTAGGLIGVVHKIVNNEEFILELEDSIKVRVIRSAISQIMAKTEPLKTQALDTDVHTTDTSDDSEKGVVKTDKKSSKNKNTTK